MSIFFFNDTATTEIYTLSLHDALPISAEGGGGRPPQRPGAGAAAGQHARAGGAAGRLRRRARRLPRGEGAHPGDADRKSTRLNSSHANISYDVFCLKK